MVFRMAICERRDTLFRVMLGMDARVTGLTVLAGCMVMVGMGLGVLFISGAMGVRLARGAVSSSA